jgi:hypothetical protein
MSDLCQVVDVEVLRNDDFFPKFRYRFELTISTFSEMHRVVGRELLNAFVKAKSA